MLDNLLNIIYIIYFNNIIIFLENKIRIYGLYIYSTGMSQDGDLVEIHEADVFALTGSVKQS